MIFLLVQGELGHHAQWGAISWGPTNPQASLSAFSWWDCQPTNHTLITTLHSTHGTELVLDRLGFFGDFLPNQHLLDNSSGHVAELKYFKQF